ncbi:MAG: hypothetical protein ACRC20_06745 [Segniliparus sp.]|uniref:hypothetical protein n=1 Tax=Segniliparus sp. TaxID=2804064 RepID=UPI003F3DA804
MRRAAVRAFMAMVLGGLALCFAGCSHLYEPRVVTVAREAPATAAAPVDAAAAKKAFCAVFDQEIQKTEDATTRFGAASAGDEQHPDTNWDDPDHWFRDMADDASIVFGYAADALEGQIASSLPGDLSAKAKDLVASMRKLGELYRQHKAVATVKDETLHQYGPTADDIDRLCGAA